MTGTLCRKCRTMVSPCTKCKRDGVRLYARGLCKACWTRHRAEFDRKPTAEETKQEILTAIARGMTDAKDIAWAIKRAESTVIKYIRSMGRATT